MRAFRVDGIVLKRQNVGEADRILTILTKDLGKIQIKAKGVRKITSKRASHIEPLNVCSLSLYKGYSLPVLTEVISLENFSGLKEDLSKIGFAYHLCELVDGLCAMGDENKEVYMLLLNVLRKMETQEVIETPSIIHEFEVALLTSLGYWSKSSIQSRADMSFFIEGILEKRLKSRQFLQKFS